jgi:hypothetical protein
MTLEEERKVPVAQAIQWQAGGRVQVEMRMSRFALNRSKAYLCAVAAAAYEHRSAQF